MTNQIALEVRFALLFLFYEININTQRIGECGLLPKNWVI